MDVGVDTSRDLDWPLSNKAVSDSGCGLQRHQVKSRLYSVPLFSLSLLSVLEGSVSNE